MEEMEPETIESQNALIFLSGFFFNWVFRQKPNLELLENLTARLGSDKRDLLMVHFHVLVGKIENWKGRVLPKAME